MPGKENILQYEFFHVGGLDAHSIAEVMKECHERISDYLAFAPKTGDDTGAGIKTVVRIYDTNDHVTQLAKEVAALENERESHLELLQRSRLARLWYPRKHGSLQRQTKTRMDAITSYCIEYITLALSGELMIAREVDRHAFRFARRDEYSELVEAAKRATNLWLFIFEPNELLADENTSVVSIL